MDTNLVMILMTATFVLGMVYGSIGKAFPALRGQSMPTGDKMLQPTISSRPIDSTFVALLSTYLPRNAGRPRNASKCVPERIHWVEAESDSQQ